MNSVVQVEAQLMDIAGNGITSKDEGGSVRSVDVNIRSHADLAKESKQDAGNASLTSIDSKTPTLVSGRQPVDGSGVTQPVSAASLPLPAGASTEARQATANGLLASIDGKLVGNPLTNSELRAAKVAVSLSDSLDNGITSKSEGIGIRSLDVNIRSKKIPVMYGCGFAGLATFSISASGDIIEIIGSASKTVKIHRVMLSGNGSSAQQATINLIKRSSIDTGGTSAIAVSAPFDSLNPAATAVIKTYTVAPTPGTTVGTICAQRKLFTLAGSSGLNSDNVELDFSGDLSPIVLRGVGESVVIHISNPAGTFTPTVSGCVIFSEE